MRRFIFYCFLIPFLLPFALPKQADAAYISVTTLNDSGPGSLRDAISQANSGDTVGFDPELVGVVVLAHTLNISKSLTIRGRKDDKLAVDGNKSVSVFTVNSGVTLNIQRLIVQNGYSEAGGGIYNSGSLIIDRSTFTNNAVTTVGGAIRNGPDATVIITNSAFTNNSAKNGGGAIYNVKGTLTVTYSVFTGNSTTGNGGAIYNSSGNMRVSNSTFDTNKALIGGAIANFPNGSDNINNLSLVSVSFSIFTGNTGSSSGGAIQNQAKLDINSGTFSKNASLKGDGGGVYNYVGPLMVRNSTFVGNAANDYGGALGNFQGTLTVANSTFSGNSAGNSGGGISNARSGMLTLGSTLVVNNTAAGQGLYSHGPDIYSENQITSLGSSFVGSSAGVNGLVASDISGVDPHLSPLADNSGPTPTMALDVTSPAVGKGNCNLPSPAIPVDRDQRDAVRNTPCTVGAYEVVVDPVVRNVNSSGVGSLPYLTTYVRPGTLITFDPTVFRTPQTIVLTNTLTLTENLTIQGPGADKLAVDGNKTVGVIAVNQGITASVSGMTIQHGSNSLAGGGITNSGVLTLNNCVVSTNHAATAGAVFNDGTLTINNCAISGNSASTGGGGVLNSGTLTANNCAISGNSASTGGGGVLNSGTLTANNCAISGNTTTADGGGIWNTGTLTISNCIISHNSIPRNGRFYWGGGLANTGVLTVNNCTVSRNVAGYGGGLSNSGNGSATISNSTISNNEADGFGGGIANSSTLAINNTTLSGNVAVRFTGGAISAGAGKVTISNSTIFNNTAKWGAAISFGDSLMITNSTIAGNHGQRGGLEGSGLTLGSSIVANNSSSDSNTYDVGGTIQSLGNNLIGKPSAGIQGLVPSDQVNVNPQLNDLTYNGGLTQTVSLQANSPAIGKGNCYLPSPGSPIVIDQRYAARQTPCDVGAFETGTDF